MMIYLTGITFTLFLALALISKKGKTQADWILFTWLIVMGLDISIYYLEFTNTILQFPYLLGCIFPLGMLHWTFLYLYIDSLTSKIPLTHRSLIHFLPFLISIISFIPFYILSNESKINIFKSLGKGIEIQITINDILMPLSGLVYIILSIIKLWRYKQIIRHEFSYLEKINLNWLIYVIVGIIVFYLTILLTWNNIYLYYALVGFVIFIGFFGIKQVGIFSQTRYIVSETGKSISEHESNPIATAENHLNNVLTEIPTIINSEIPKSINKYEKSTLTDESATNIHQDLIRIMQSEQLYKNPDLTLDELSEALSVLPNHLSQVINSLENKTFYDYINQLRVNEFIGLISKVDNKKYTLLSLAFECGFNSKSSFNRNFKKVTGLTPSEYLKQKL